MELEHEETVAEPETDDDDAQPGDGDDGEGGEEEAGEDAEAEAPAQPSGPTPEEMEARFKRSERAFQTYAKRITDIFEEQAAELVPCPLCVATVPGFVHPEEAGRQPADVKATVQAFLGVVQRAQYRKSPTTHRCEVCDGLGKLDTDSQVPNYDLEVCAKCQGTGRYPPPGLQANGGLDPGEVTALVGVGGDAPLHEDSDPWGSPRLLDSGLENPNYGRMPQYKDPGLP